MPLLCDLRIIAVYTRMCQIHSRACTYLAAPVVVVSCTYTNACIKVTSIILSFLWANGRIHYHALNQHSLNSP